MSNIPISSLPIAVSLDGTEEVPLVQGGTTKRATTSQIANFPVDTGTFVTATTQPLLTQSRLLSAQIDVTTVTDGGALGNITIGIATNGIGNTQLRQGAGLSVIGNATNAVADVTDIAAASDFQILRRSGTAVGFGSIDLSQSNAVGSSVLRPVNGGTGIDNGTSTLTLGGSLTTSGAFDSTFTMTGATNVTFPTSGTLATTSGPSLPAVVQGDLLYGSGVNTLATLPKNTTATRYLGNTGTANNPAWSQVDLTTGVTGTLPATNGGTSQNTYATGDTLYASAANTLNKLSGNVTTAKQYLSQTGSGSASAAPVWAIVAGGDITGAALTKTDDTNVTLTLGGTPATALLRAASIAAGWSGQLAVPRGGTGLAAGTSGGILGFTGTTTLASSGLLTQNAILLGGGAGATPSALGSLGTTTTVLHGNPAGAPTFGAVSLTADVSSILPLANGGTNANLTASTGGIFYSTATAGAILAATATAGQMLRSGASAAPAWSSATWPASTTINRILYSSAANVVGEITTANGGLLNTSSAGVPSITPTPVLGVAGTTVGSIGFQNATSGTQTITPATGALGSGVATLLAGTYNLLGDFLAQTLTNKTATSSTNVLGGVTMTLGSDATGDIYYRSAGGLLTRLAIGSSANVLTVSAGVPAWTPAAGGGNVSNSGTPTAGQYAVWTNATTIQGVTPTNPVPILLSGSGNYTPAAGTRYIRISGRGGGGGGGSSGTNVAPGTVGTNGSNTTFGSSLLSAGGGAAAPVGGGSQYGGLGGTGTVSAPAISLGTYSGSDGGASTYQNTAVNDLGGGIGGGSCSGGGGGGGGANRAGRAGKTASGGGGGGGGIGAIALSQSGSGGGGGGCFYAQINAPFSGAPYAYSVGPGGTGATAGTSGFAGGDGASGLIVVEEYY